MKVIPSYTISRSRLSEIHSIQTAAYRYEADLIGAPSLPPLNETLNDLLNSTDEIFIAVENDRIQGAIFLEKFPSNIVISKLIVDPGCFRRGIGRSLVHFCLEQYKEFPFSVSTGANNSPAIKLYESLGFMLAEIYTVEGNLLLSRLERKPFNI